MRVCDRQALYRLGGDDNTLNGSSEGRHVRDQLRICRSRNIRTHREVNLLNVIWLSGAG